MKKQNENLLSCLKKTVEFRVNFEKLIAHVHFNRIDIMTAQEFRLIDTLKGHKESIKCLDVSLISKTIVSLSPGLLLIHTLAHDPQEQADNVIVNGAVRWTQNWSAELKLPIISVNISPIGDFIALSGEEVFSVWTRDSLGLQSFSNSIFYSKHPDKNVLASVIQTMNLAKIVQQDISNDGRLIFCKEEHARTVKVFHVDKLTEAVRVLQEAAKPKEMSYSDYKQKQMKKEEKVQILDFNPYADPNFGKEGYHARIVDQNFQVEELVEYELPLHSQPVEYFKIMHHDIFECEKRTIPNVVLTFTSKNEVFLWQENLMNDRMQFVCVHIFRGYHTASYFDASFLQFPPINPKRLCELTRDMSKIFDSGNDKVLRVKKEDNKFGVYHQSYQETTFDWVFVLVDQTLEVHKVHGLRNFPNRSIQVEVFNRIRMNSHPRDFFGTSKIYSSSCRDFNDILSLYTLNQDGQLIKLRKDFKEQGSGKWKVDKVTILRYKEINAPLCHSSLPLIAYLIKHSEIYFYVEEESKAPIVKRNDMRFLGAYSVFRQSKSQQHPVKEDLRILSAKWVKGFAQMLIHYNNNSIGFVTSHTQLRILAYDKLPEEYLKLWREKRNHVNEKWEKLFEIQFDEGLNQEKIVDFEVLDSQVAEGGFKIFIAIFTSNNQYLVYETQTSILSNLKTISKTSLLYAAHSSHSVLRILSSYNGFPESKAVMLALTEEDPAKYRAPPAPAVQEPEEESEEEDESSEEVDIFEMVSAKPKAKKQKVPKAKPVVVVESAPSKYSLFVKLMVFEDSGLKLKKHQEPWSVEVPLSFKDRPLTCRVSSKFAAILVADKKNDLNLFIYDLMAAKYVGFVNFSLILGYQVPEQTVDFVLSEGGIKGSLIIYHRDTIYLLAQSAREGEPGKWSVIQQYAHVAGYQGKEMESVMIAETPKKKILMVVNHEHLFIHQKYPDLNQTKEENLTQHYSLNQLFTASQKSFAIYDPRLLRSLFIKGYGSLVLKVLVRLLQVLRFSLNSSARVSEFLDFELSDIIQEIVETQKAQLSKTQPAKKKANASSLFDDFYGFDEPKKEEAKKPEEDRDAKLQRDFEEGFKVFLQDVNEKAHQMLGFDAQTTAQFVDFLKRFHAVYKKDFYVDGLTSILMRQLFLDKEEVEAEEEEKGQMDMHAFMMSMKNQGKSKGSVKHLAQWTSLQTALALHSESQEVILNELEERFDFGSNMTWEMMKKLAIPLWLKDVSKLRTLVEKVAKNEYRTAGDDFNNSSKAEKTAMWYILLNKKNLLCALYKQEAQHKKVYELLLNDFTQKKWKTTAEKNAMVLMSKKNNLLACAFFALASNVSSALQCAIGRMNDPILGVLICRLLEGEDSPNLNKLYAENFVERGEKENDPYLQNIGRWGQREYLKALNLFEINMERQNNVQFLLREDQPAFNILHSKAASQAPSDAMVPHVSKYDYFAIDFIRALKKAPNVKRQLNSNWALDGMGGGSIFDDDIFGDAPMKKEVKKEEPKVTVSEARVLEYVTLEASQQGYSLVALAVLNENQEFVEQVSMPFKKALVDVMIIDVVQSMAQSSESFSAVQKLTLNISSLCQNVGLEERHSLDFARAQINRVDNLSLQINYLLEGKKEEAIFKLEEEALKLIDFVSSIAQYPFIINGEHRHQKDFDLARLISFLEQLVECYMLIDYEAHAQQSPQRQEAFNVADPEGEEANYQFSVEEGKTIPQIPNLNVQTKLLSTQDMPLNQFFDHSFQTMSTKIRTGLMIYLALLQMCLVTCKFRMVKDLLIDLKGILSISSGQTASEINVQKLKTLIQKFKYSLKMNQQPDPAQPEPIPDPNFKTEEQLALSTKTNQFLALWVRYITVHSIFDMVKKAFGTGHVKSLVDLRPSIVNYLPMRSVVETIINPKLASSDILKKFLGMDRILENVSTYYFENFLSLSERNIVLDEIKQFLTRASPLKTLDPLALFSSHKKFLAFAETVDLKSFLRHLGDHELSLVYHTNYEYSARTVERTQELFQSGIDIFRMKGETINAFAFDNCNLDLVAMAMLTKGIREIPMKKALLYRNRTNKGTTVLDEEQQTWLECLHRFDKVAQEHKDLRSTNEPIIAAVDKLYSYKTINYTKKPRRGRGTLFLDYEMSPPDMWSGLKSSEFTKTRSNLEITHEDYSNAIESHPFLPQFVTGNAKGLLCLWNFNQNDDKSLDQWVTDQDVKNVNPKKGTIKKIAFSKYGDKLFCSSMEGSVFMFKFDTMEHAPIYSIKKSKENNLKFNDFEILNYDSVLALSSLKPKKIWIYDTLIYQNNGLVMESPVGGNVLIPRRSKNHLYVFNEKPGQVNIFDMKMNKVVQSFQLHPTEEVSSVTMNEFESTLVAGFKDGTIKIFNIDKDFDLREQFLAFTPLGAKKSVVSQVKIHPATQALFASSNTGNFKLFRIKV